ncbi:MAG: hypothetical protein ACOVPA_22770 [Rubrivivax sp.]
MSTPVPPRRTWPRRAGSAAVLLMVLGLTACATTQPVIYSKKTDSIELNERTRKDLGECSRQADVRVGRNGMQGTQGTQKVAQKVGSTGAIGFVATAVGSVVSNSKGAWERARGAAAGGAAGMATKLLLDWNEGDEVYQKYVEGCLENRGHEVLGWR